MKTLHGSGISTNIIDNNEVSTNVTIQTKCMHKTNDNRNNKNKYHKVFLLISILSMYYHHLHLVEESDKNTSSNRSEYSQLDKGGNISKGRELARNNNTK